MQISEKDQITSTVSNPNRDITILAGGASISLAGKVFGRLIQLVGQILMVAIVP